MEKYCILLSEFDLPETAPPAGYSLQRLTGDASSRSYFRIRIPDGRTLVLMKMPEPFDETHFPYLENYHLFRSLGVRLAEIYYMSPSKGFVVLQDLGDATLYELYEGWSESERLHQYLGTINIMLKITKGNPKNGLAFDTEKFLWELNYFYKNFLLGLRKIQISPDENEAFQHEFRKLSEELAAQPRVFCHRDYHSRNVMFQEMNLYVIDFQDARWGPVTYDFASLCYDSYIQHDPSFLHHLERLFFTYYPDERTQRFEYPRMCLQRNLKALGTFGYQTDKLGRDFYLQFVGPTLGYVKRHLSKLPEYGEMSKLLARHLPELK
jgi:N-acetylmuramate 1-kinase